MVKLNNAETFRIIDIVPEDCCTLSVFCIAYCLIETANKALSGKYVIAEYHCNSV